MKWLKGNLSHCWATKLGALQLSMVGRALPEGNLIVLNKALASHETNLTTTFTTSNDILESAVEYAFNWGKKNLKRDFFSPLGVKCSAGSCLENNRRQGGSTAALVDLLWKPQM